MNAKLHIIYRIGSKHYFGALSAFRNVEMWASWITWLKADFALPDERCGNGDIQALHRPSGAAVIEPSMGKDAINHPANGDDDSATSPRAFRGCC